MSLSAGIIGLPNAGKSTLFNALCAGHAAGTIHSDFEKGFVKADVYTVEELERYTSEHSLRTAGRVRSEGREYVVKDGEILFFKFTA